MKRETFVAILSAALAEADVDLVIEAQNLIQGRYRILRQLRVQQFRAGQDIVYLARDGHTHRRGTIDHLNRFSVTVLRPHPTEGTASEVVGVERIIGDAQMIDLGTDLKNIFNRSND